MFRIIKRLPWIAAGGAAVWFLDPERGRERRIIAQHRFAELTGRDTSDPRSDVTAAAAPHRHVESGVREERPTDA